ncbi:MAG TPA: DUF1549 domain-containing protein, partial [Roseimicrobium sp.]|nr:DUF1549 domain-containing protein [Roseimicrobium sp.]
MRLLDTHNTTPTTTLRLMLAIVMAAAMSSCRPPAKEAATAPVPKPPRFQSISAYPAEITLRTGKDHHRILATGTNAGWEVHIDRDVRFTSTPAGVVKVDADGTVTGLKPGKAQVRVEADTRSAVVSVEVVPDSTGGQLGFTSDVLPVLSRSGCNAGGCHAKPEGQNHFKLSVFAYDPKGDYHAIVRDDRGRRVFPAAPGESLLLQKATLAVEHEGGQRFEPGSEPFKTLVEWIRQGMPYSLTNEVELVDIRVFPAERRYQKGAKQPLLVQARYSDDSVRDITALADFSSNDKDVATVDEFGHVQVGTANGEGVIVVRFMGQVAVSRITVPADRMLPDSLYAALPVNNEIDRVVYNRLKGLGIAPSETCTDSEFIRRSSLDAIGTLPAPEQVKAFLADTDPAKRNKWIDQLLENPAYAHHWAVKWGDLIRPNPSRVGVKPVYLLDLWLRDSFRQNKPYDQMVKELLTAEGSTHRHGPAAIFRDKRDPADASAFVSQIFMGVRMDCAKCHHHPNEKWSQDDYFQLAAFFTQTKHKGQGISAPISGEPEFIWYAPGGTVKNPVSGQVMKPKPPDG